MNPPASVPRWERFTCVVLVLVASAFFLFKCWQDAAAQQRVQQPVSYDIPLQNGQTTTFPLLPLFADPDSICWSVYAHELIEKQTWRLKESPIGNAPAGRPMLWSHLYLWWILGLGAIVTWISGVPLSEGVDMAILLANPLAFVLFGFFWFRAIKKNFGSLAASVSLFLLCSFGGVNLAFGWWHPDHHGFHLIGMLGSFTAVVIGINRLFTGDTVPPNRFFLTAGVLGGCGFWIGATQQAVFVGVTGLVALAGGILLPFGRVAAWGKAWSLWAISGACTSLLAFMIEFFPDVGNARIEVNHPLYAAAWFGGGLLILGICDIRTNTRQSGILKILLGLPLVLLLPIGILSAPLDDYSLRDPVILRCHQFIAEFQPAAAFYTLPSALREFGVSLVFIPIVLWSAITDRRRPATAWPNLLALSVAVVFGILTSLQMRWSTFFQAALVIMGMLMAGEATSRSKTGIAARAAVAATIGIVFVGMGFDVAAGVREILAGILRPNLAIAIGTRDIAVTLRRENGTGSLRVLGPDGWSPALYAYGKIGAVGGLYWENFRGIRDAARFFATADDAIAEKIARERGITHVLVQSSPEAAVRACWLTFGTTDPAIGRLSLAWRLAQPKPAPPPWLILEKEQRFLGLDYPVRCYRILN